MSAEKKSAQMFELDTSIDKRSGPHDYSWKASLTQAERAAALLAIQPNLLGNHDVVRNLTQALLQNLQVQRINGSDLPDTLNLKIYTHGDIYVMLRLFYAATKLRVSVRLGLQSNALGQRTTDISSTVIQQTFARLQRGRGTDVEVARPALSLANALRALGMMPTELTADETTVTLGYLWAEEETLHSVYLVARLED